MPASLLDMRLWRNSKNGHTHITLRLLPRDRGDLVRVGSMLSKNSVISEVGGVCETDDLFCSCFRVQLLGPGGQMVLSTQLTLTPV
jgi:hypothetical protein